MRRAGKSAAGGGGAKSRRDDLIQRFERDPRRKCRTRSKGNSQKVAIVAALASDVELLILDEPTNGLDPVMEAVFQDCIREAKVRGTTVLLSSHILSEVEALCDQVSIIRAGTVVETGTLAEMRHLTRTSLHASWRSSSCGTTRAPADDGHLHRTPAAVDRAAGLGGTPTAGTGALLKFGLRRERIPMAAWIYGR